MPYKHGRDAVVVLLAIDPSTRETGWAVFSMEASRQGKGILREDPSELPTHKYVEEFPQAHASCRLLETGVIVVHHRPQKVEVEERVRAIEEELERMAEERHLQEIACGKPPPMQLPYQQLGMNMLSHALERWAGQHDLPFYPYSLREIRSAIIGRANSAREELAYAVMTRWGLLGEVKTTHEWNAIAVGDYHLVRQELAGHPEQQSSLDTRPGNKLRST